MGMGMVGTWWGMCGVWGDMAVRHERYDGKGEREVLLLLNTETIAK